MRIILISILRECDLPSSAVYDFFGCNDWLGLTVRQFPFLAGESRVPDG